MQEMIGIEAEQWVRDGKQLPDNLVVNWYLDLTYCTALTSLPDNLVVNGNLNLGDCTALTSLPDNLVVKGNLYLNNCTALTSLPDNLVVNGSLYLWGFTNLTSSVRWLFPKYSVKCEYPPIGYIQDDGTVLIKAGCFSGNLEEAHIRSKGREDYVKAIDDIESEWNARISA